MLFFVTSNLNLFPSNTSWDSRNYSATGSSSYLMGQMSTQAWKQSCSTPCLVITTKGFWLSKNYMKGEIPPNQKSLNKRRKSEHRQSTNFEVPCISTLLRQIFQRSPSTSHCCHPLLKLEPGPCCIETSWALALTSTFTFSNYSQTSLSSRLDDHVRAGTTGLIHLCIHYSIYNSALFTI